MYGNQAIVAGNSYADASGSYMGNSNWHEVQELQKALGTGGSLTGGQPAGTGAPGGVSPAHQSPHVWG